MIMDMLHYHIYIILLVITNFNDIIQFLIFHYNNWGGRVLWFFVEIVLLKISISAYRIVQSIITLSIFYLIYKLISKIKKIENYKLALTTVMTFGLIEIMVLRDGFYWFTASVLYLFPILPIMLYIYLTHKDEKRKTWSNILCVFLLFIASWSQEQVSVFIVAYVGLQFLYKLFIKKKIDKWDIIFLITVLCGFGILMLSPGTKMRVDGTSYFYSLNIFQKIARNVPIILSTIFGKDTKIFTVLFLTSIVYILITNRNKFKYKWLIDTTIISTIIIILASIFTKEGYIVTLISIGKFNYFFMFLYTLQLALTFLMLIISYYNNKEYIMAFIVVSSICSQAIMIMAPYMPHRSVTIFEIMSFITVIYACTDLMKKKNFNYNYILIPLLVIAITNYATITNGYYENDSIKANNNKLLIETSKKIKKGENIKKVVLKPSTITYGTYEPEGVYGLMKYYYEIPQEVEIIYGN